MLNLLTVEGKVYLNAVAWPETVVLADADVKGFDKRLTAWDGERLKLWLENGNAVYTVVERDADLGVTRLAATFRSDVGSVPGNPTVLPDEPQELVTEKSVLQEIGFTVPIKEQREVIVPSGHYHLDQSGLRLVPAHQPFQVQQEVGKAIQDKLYDQMAREFYRAVQPTAQPIFQAELGPMAKALLAAQGQPLAPPAYPNPYGTLPGTPPSNPFSSGYEYVQALAEADRAREQWERAQLGQMYGLIPLTHDQAARQWRDFLTDIGGFLSFLTEMMTKLSAQSYKNARGQESKVWLQQPLAAQGRLSQWESRSWEGAPTEMTLKEMMGQMATSANLLAARGTELMVQVAPVKADACAAAQAAEDDAVLKEVDALTAKIGEERYPGEWPVPSTVARGEIRQLAWTAWAKEESEDE